MEQSPESRRVAIVTGGTRGIGRAIVRALRENGCTVWWCGRSEGSVRRAAEELGGPDPLGRAVDVRDPAAVEAFVAEIHRVEGRLDILVNNAGLGRFGAVGSLSLEDWQLVVRTNLDGAFHFLHSVASRMVEAGEGGLVVNIASLAARHPFAGGAAYNASKYGLLGLSDAAMLDLRPHGIRVVAVLPGSVDTEFRSADPDRDVSWMLQPQDVARAVVDLLGYPERALPSRLELRPTRTAAR